jgi:hypothetical protein
MGNGSRNAEARAKAAQIVAEQRRKERRRRVTVWTSVGAGVVVVGAVVALAVSGTHSAPSVTEAGAVSLTASGASSAPPWAAPADASARPKTAGLAMLASEGTVEHIHTHLSVSVDGKAVTVPAEVGIDETAQRISPLHTHDTSGIVHVESDVKRDFSLGEFFTEWNVALSAGQIGSYSTSGGYTVTTFVDGKERAGNPASILLADHEDVDIVVTHGGAAPAAPAAFTWPAGY